MISGRTLLTPICISWSFQIPFGPSRYRIESSICDNLKHQKRCLEVLFFLECTARSDRWRTGAETIRIAIQLAHQSTSSTLHVLGYRRWLEALIALFCPIVPCVLEDLELWAHLMLILIPWYFCPSSRLAASIAWWSCVPKRKRDPPRASCRLQQCTT